jgi:hypothetical protein
MDYFFVYRHKKNPLFKRVNIIGVLEGTRTPDRTLRRRMLYPAELQGQRCIILSNKTPHFKIQNHFLGLCSRGSVFRSTSILPFSIVTIAYDGSLPSLL